MRVVVDARTATGHFPGIGRYVASLAEALAQIPGLDLALLYDPAAVRQPLPAVQLVPCPVSPFAVRQQWCVPGQLRRLGAAIYHSPYYLMPYRPGVPPVVTVYDMIPLIYPAYFTAAQRLIFYAAHVAALRAARAVLAISEATRQDLARRFHVDASRIAVTPLAAAPQFRPAAAAGTPAVRARHGLPERYLLYVGSNKPHKNLVRLVEAWRLAAQELARSAGAAGDHLGLVIAGPWDPRYEEPRRAAERQGLSGTIRFLDRVAEEDLPALYAGALAFVFPSLYEGFGLPVLEAMACGTPVACAATSSLPEVAGDAALVLDPTSTEGIAAAIVRLAQDEGLRAGLRARGLAQAARFSWARTAQATAAVYEGIAGS